MHAPSRGFTLLELMLVIAVVAIMVTLGLPSLGAALERSRRVALHNDFLSALQYARGVALVQRVETVVCPHGGGDLCTGDGIWDRGWLVFVDVDGDRRLGDADRLLRRTDRSGEPALRSSRHRSRIAFRSNGLAWASNLTVRICDRSGQAVGGLVVNNLGRARRLSPGAGDPRSSC